MKNYLNSRFAQVDNYGNKFIILQDRYSDNKCAVFSNKQVDSYMGRGWKLWYLEEK